VPRKWLIGLASRRALIRYPYKVFYRNTGKVIEILYIHHAAQDEQGGT
jgi:hypothetical protein